MTTANNQPKRPWYRDDLLCAVMLTIVVALLIAAAFLAGVYFGKGVYFPGSGFPLQLEVMSEQDRQVKLEWQVKEPQPHTVTWQHQWKTGGDRYGPWLAMPSSTAQSVNYTVSGLAGGLAYTFRVRSLNGTEAMLSQPASVFIPDTRAELPTTLNQTVSIKLPTTLEQTLKTAVEDGFAEGLEAMQKHLDGCLEQHNEKSCQFWQDIDRRVKHLECKPDKCPKGKACAAKAPKECSKATKP